MSIDNPPPSQAPPAAPSFPAPEKPEISEIGSLGTIFFEPERTFKDFKRKPRFLIAGVIIALLVFAYTFSLTSKLGEAGLRNAIAEQIDRGPQGGSLSAEQKKGAVDMQMTINKYTRFAVPVFVFISFLIGGLLYWAASKAFGGTGMFLQNVSVWVYAGLPPAILSMVLSMIVLMFKSADDIDLVASQRGMLQASPAFFVDGKAHPILATFLSTLDVFAIWGWILAAIGLRVVNNISKGSAWAVVLIFVIVGLAFRLLGAFFTGNAS